MPQYYKTVIYPFVFTQFLIQWLPGILLYGWCAKLTIHLHIVLRLIRVIILPYVLISGFLIKPKDDFSFACCFVLL
jgi:hypothetical protein